MLVDFSASSFESLPEAFRTVLVVDDNEMLRQYLKDVLSRGFGVYEAASGDEALRLALQSRPWLILTDVTMPGLDGLEQCRSIRRHSQDLGTFVVLSEKRSRQMQTLTP